MYRFNAHVRGALENRRFWLAEVRPLPPSLDSTQAFALPSRDVWGSLVVNAACPHIEEHTHIYIYIYAYGHINLSLSLAYLYMCTHMYTCICTRIHRRIQITYMYTYTHAYMLYGVDVHVYIYTDMYIYIYIHRHGFMESHLLGLARGGIQVLMPICKHGEHSSDRRVENPAGLD